jgi:hypothetical protein
MFEYGPGEQSELDQRRQDKSRKVRLGRTGAERKGINDLAQCAFHDRTLSVRATCGDINTIYTLLAFS